ncbi:YafY family protein [uncultured Duncaniella sp.]|uniref:helix-turn-helix transcriptional regulator n=1 Tax=uncultured Duncaniella sp. TaxID=2768039 RepID=UPI002666B1DC|nr:WYL domain-containing protein [uncultured Duncaniella sp.]
MPINRSALIRISTIDRCLQNHYRRWTIDDLIEACTEALAEYEGRCNPVSRRTFQNDIALMRSDRLGYNAPIIVKDHKYYMYDDPDYSITHLPLNDEGLDALNSAMDVLRQLQGFPQLAPAMDIERNPDYRGMEHLGVLYDAVRRERTLVVTYQSFRARNPEDIVVYPYLLKEYRNRWFLIGEKQSNHVPQVNIFAIDRIKSVRIDTRYPFKRSSDFDPLHYFDDTIGVTRLINDKPRRVVIKVDRSQAPYVETKPLHSSQKVEERLSDGAIMLSLNVVINYELERLILGYGMHMEVISPLELREQFARQFRKCVKMYSEQ